MPVLPVLGYKPITSYFSRKRKETSEIVNEAKRQRPSRPSTSGEPTRPAKRHTEEEGDREIDDGRPSTEDVPLTPVTRPYRRKKGVVLPTPPTTAAPSRKASGRERNTPSDRLGPPKLTIPETRLLAINPTILGQVGDSGAANITWDCTIPPPQSQTVDELEDLGFPPDSHPANVNKTSSGDDHFARKSMPDSNVIVESSQSQYLVIESPRKQEKEQRIWSSFSTVDPIPSSQSQEEELVIPCKFPSECVGTSLPVSKMGHSSAPRRTSEELFSVPNQDSSLLFLDEKVEAPLCVNSPVHLHEFVMESETEEEFPLDTNINTDDGSPILQSAATQDSLFQSSHGPGSYSSLPLAVLEFKEMFGDGDESYPADFPESLRS